MNSEWCRRRRREAMWHIVESHIEDRSVTKCGHQMREVDQAGCRLETVYVEPDQWSNMLCLMCHPSLSQKTR